MNLYTHFPDTRHDKEVIVVAAGHSFDGRYRHAYLAWCNGQYPYRTHPTAPYQNVYQIVQLAQKSDGTYYYADKYAERRTEQSESANQKFSLDTFSSKERQAILRLAGQVQFARKSKVNGCRTWLHDLLVAMHDAELITEEKLEELKEGVPLPERLPE
ncbi:hypothetical protein OF83DRAFT_1111309 [Amylostereum chailletii]|nr:hypothetical protein OF83DRAFT_1111309 [Amylostereum chailletii]